MIHVEVEVDDAIGIDAQPLRLAPGEQDGAGKADGEQAEVGGKTTSPRTGSLKANRVGFMASWNFQTGPAR